MEGFQSKQQERAWSAPNKTRFRRAIEIKKLIELGRLSKMGEQFAYSYLSEIAGRPVRCGNAGYPSLRAAIKTLRSEGIHFATVSDDWKDGKQIEGGIKRIDDKEALSLAPHDLNAIRSRAHTLLEKVEHVAYEDLPEDMQVLHNTLTTVGRSVQYLTDSEIVEKIEEKVRQGNCPIPTREVALML